MPSVVYIDTIINAMTIMFLIVLLLIIVINFVDLVLDNQIILISNIEKDKVDDGVTVIDDEESVIEDEECVTDEVEDHEDDESVTMEEEMNEEESLIEGEEESVIEDEEESVIEDDKLTIDSDEDDMNEINSEMRPLKVAGKSSESLSDEEDRIVGHKMNRFFSHTINNLLKIRLIREKRMRLDKVE